MTATKTHIRTDTIALTFHEDEAGGMWMIGNLVVSSYTGGVHPYYSDSLKGKTYHPTGSHPWRTCQEQAKQIAFLLYAQITGIDPETGREWE